MGYTCNQQKGWHVFYDGSAVCVCCLKANPNLQRCQHRPQAEVRVQDKPDDKKELEQAG